MSKVRLTTHGHGSLLDRAIVKNASGLENIQGLVAGVGDLRLDFAIADHLDFDIDGRVTLADVDSKSVGQSGEVGKTGDELHSEYVTRETT